MMWSYGEDVLKTEWRLYNHTQRKDEVFAVLVGWLCGFFEVLQRAEHKSQ